MHRAALPLTSVLVALLLMLTACSGDDADRPSGGGADGDGAGRSLEICGALQTDDLERLVGEPVTIEDKRLLGAGICHVKGAEGSQILSIVSESKEAALDDIVQELVLSAEDHRTEMLEIEGAVEAAEVEDTMSGMSSRSLVATVEGGWYAITPFVGATRDDERRIMVAAMTLLLGGELPADAVIAPIDVPHPCDLVDEAAAARVLGRAVTSERNDAVDGLRQCYFRPNDDPAAFVIVSDFADRPALEGIRGLEDRLGSVEDVTADGLVEAFLSARDDDPTRVTGWAATQDATYQVSPDPESADALDQARGLLELLGAAAATLR